jgi:xylulose-5-phosphate/fructose-6-phosphate phosphoketolase
MSATPYANGGLRQALPPLELVPYEVGFDGRGRSLVGNTVSSGELMRDLYAATDTFRLFSPDETASNRLQAVFEVTDRCFMGPVLETDDHLSADGRVMEVLSEHLCQGWLEGYTLTGRHGVFATYEAFAMVSASMAVQHVKWLQHAQELPWRASVPSLNVLLTSTCWRNDHNGFSHQGPGLIDAMLPLSPGVVRVWLPPDANTTLSVMDHCLRSQDHVNLIVVDKQPHLQYLTLEEAHRHNAAGAGIWEWASSCPEGESPDVVLACAGDVPTQEALAAAELLRDYVPDLRVRFVNVVDLMALLPENDHPHGFADRQFDALFTRDRDVVFAFHGYPRAVHQVIHGRSDPGRFHVRGFSEQGTTTTPFDMVVLNRMSRFHLAQEVLRRASRRVDGWDRLQRLCEERLAEHAAYIVTHLEDMPDVAEWTWRG